ncbi:uncharacterized protein LOC118477889 [Aplysia californica]|uniref:Uncharacterized protein LOC118477889 n=1 Tax=Aplysia californica TaxID=6500 RepID=A0ABM1VVE9_APLCA|nr:uncharacterized protein LOC118477889 [Aplysia californica]
MWKEFLKRRTENIETTLRLDGGAGLVAFQAFFSDSSDQSSEDMSFPNTSAPIVFPHVPLNVIDAYDSQTGKFTVPKENIYLLATRVSTAFGSGSAIFSIYRNEQVLAKAETHSLRQEPDGVTAVAIARLERGEVVEVRSELTSSARIYRGSNTWFLAISLNPSMKDSTPIAVA